MTILEQIELRLYRFAQQAYTSKDRVKAAQEIAVEIFNLVSDKKVILSRNIPDEKIDLKPSDFDLRK